MHWMDSRNSIVEQLNCPPMWFSNKKFKRNSIRFSNSEGIIAKSTIWTNVTKANAWIFFYAKRTYMRFSDHSINEIRVFCNSCSVRLLNSLICISFFSFLFLGFHSHEARITWDIVIPVEINFRHSKLKNRELIAPNV